MGILMRLLRKLFGAVIGDVFKGRVSNTILLVATIAAFTGLTVGFIALMDNMLLLISVTSPSEAQWGFGFMPDNLPKCVAAVVDARLAYWVYSFKSGLLNKRTELLRR